jgi:hypothetical protein
MGKILSGFVGISARGCLRQNTPFFREIRIVLLIQNSVKSKGFAGNREWGRKKREKMAQLRFVENNE